MTITLAFLTSVLIILPGLVALAAFNLRAGKAGARRPEQALTSISALVAALLISLSVHLLSFSFAEGALRFAAGIHDTYPTLNAGRLIADPIETFYRAVTTDSPMPTSSALGLAVILALQVAAVTAFVGSDTFDLLIDRVDLGGRGWVFQHVTRPAEHGYAPIGHVFTSTMSEGFGVAYKGVIIDVRQSEKGEVLAIALSRPERFLYKLGSFEEAPSKRWPWQSQGPPAQRDDQMGIALHPKDYVGGVVALDAKVISNIVVHSISQSLLEELGSGDEEDDGDAPG